MTGRPLRICILHNSPPGGAHRFVAEMAVRLSRHDAVTVCTWGDEPDPPLPGVHSLWCPGPRFFLPQPLHPFSNLARSYFGSIRAAAAVDAAGFDVALVSACQWAQAPEALRRLRTPHLYFAQEGRRRTLESGYRPSLAPRHQRLMWAAGRKVFDALGSWLDRRAIAAAQVLVTNSEFTAAQLSAGYGVSPHVVELGVDVEGFFPSMSQTRRPMALLVGALDPTKGADLAVAGLALVEEAQRPTLRLIANRGDPVFERTVMALGARHRVVVEILRNISDEQLRVEYQSAGLLLALAHNEPFGLTVLEASACGTPTVAVDEGGYRRTVDPEWNGVRVPRDPAAVAAAVTELRAGTRVFDPLRMAEWTATNWGWDRCVRQVRDQLVQCAQAGRRGRGGK